MEVEEYSTPREEIEKPEELGEDLEEYADQVDELEATFTRASTYLQSLAASLTSEQLLYFYGRYKQAIEGPCHTPKPGFFDFKGKQKWDAWKALDDMSKEEAMTQYIDGISDINPDWQLITPGGSSAQSRTWVTVSSLASQDESAPKRDEDKDDFDWVKENNVEKIREGDPEIILSARDGNGMTVLHWAVDRGYLEMTEVLIEKGFNVNVQDESGQTALHYAASCGHLDVVKLLLSNGAHTTIVDVEGTLPVDCADDHEIKSLLE